METESSIIAEKLFILSTDELLKNKILSQIFKYLYINIISIKTNKLILHNLCYTLSFNNIQYGKECLKSIEDGLLIVKKKYIPNVCILLYKNKKRYFCINMNMENEDIIGVSEILDL
jgi:hypothetical protein